MNDDKSSAVVSAFAEAVATVITFTALYLYLTRDHWYTDRAARVRAYVNRGRDTRAWMTSPRARFARHERETMVAAEFTVSSDCGCSDVS